MNKKTNYTLYSFFIVYTTMVVCLLIQEMQIKFLTQFSVLVSFIGGMVYMILILKKIEQRGKK